MRKPVFGFSNQIQHKTGCTASENRFRLAISDLSFRAVPELVMWGGWAPAESFLMGGGGGGGLAEIVTL